VPFIAVAAHKGGCGKTSITVHLAGAAARVGKRVLVVDVDPQGAAGAALGVTATKPTLYEVLVGTAKPSEAVRATVTERLSVLPADMDLAGAEVELPRAAGWQATLRARLGSLRGFDVCLIDTAPGLGVLPYVALAGADRAIIVCTPDYLSYRSLPSVLEATGRARVKVIGIVPNRVEHRTRHEAEVLDELRSHYGQLVLGEVPSRVVIRDAGIAGQPLSSYAPQSDAAAAFDRLAKEVLA